MISNNGPNEPRVDGATPLDGVDDTDDLLSKFEDWEKALEAKYSPWQTEGRLCYDFVAGEQWTTEERALMLDGPDGAQRIPVVFNRVAPTIDAVCGAEIQGRQQVQYFPREVGDTGVADVLTQGVDFLMDQCDGNEEDSEAFRDCLICGVGVVEIRPDEEDGQINIIKERVDPLEVLFDASSRKANFADARYLRREKHMSRQEFYELFPDEESVEGDNLRPRRPVIVDPRLRYKNGTDQTDDGDDVVVCEWQWWEPITQYLMPNPDDSGNTVTIDEETHAQLIAIDPELPSQPIKAKRYRRAFVSGQIVMSVEDMATDDFSYTATTGKRDRNKGYWYGLVRSMLDPQRFANKFYSQILHIINSNAKGGIMVEEGAVDDIRNLESTWAATDLPTIVKDGSLSNANGPRIVNKPTTPYPVGSERMMEVSTNAIRDVTGVNPEMLGLADRNQPGILEHQRKQAAYGILAAFFDNTRRSLKMQGRKILKLMQKFIPPDRLVRIVGEQGSPQYVPLALNPGATEYDVSVDEAPAGPNQKDKTFQLITQMMPLLANANLPGSVWADITLLSPLPASLAQKIAKGLMEQEANEAKQAQQQAPTQERAVAAEINLKEADARHRDAQTQALGADMQTGVADTMSKDQVNRAQAGLNTAKTIEIMRHPRETGND